MEGVGLGDARDVVVANAEAHARLVECGLLKFFQNPLL